MGNIENSIVNQKFAHDVIESLSLANGLICNSIHELDKHKLDELHQKSLLESYLPNRFVAPLMSQLIKNQDVSYL
jgi:hypothetical protein